MNQVIKTQTLLRLRCLTPLAAGCVLLIFAGWNRYLERVIRCRDEDLTLSQGFFEKPCGAINQWGQSVIPFCYKRLDSPNEFGLSIAEDSSGHFGCLDRHGDVVIPSNGVGLRNSMQMVAPGLVEDQKRC